MTIAELEGAWGAIGAPPAASELGGRRPPSAMSVDGILIAVDRNGTRHLLLEAPPESVAPSTRAVKGLTVEVTDLQVGERPGRCYFDVACADPTMNHNFANVAAEIIDRFGTDPSDPRRLLERTFDRWRWFWGTPDGELSETAAVGLFGELWFLEHWIAPLSQSAVETWTGPWRDRHDFKSVAASVEVKATRARSDGSATHRISGLDQLADPETGKLFLFSLRVTSDPIGGHSLAKSVDRLRGQLSTKPDALRVLDESLRLAGYTPVSAERHDAPMRVTAEELFEVGESFPRLTPYSFPLGPPSGVDDIRYSLDLAACADWKIAGRPTDPAAIDLKNALLS